MKKVILVILAALFCMNLNAADFELGGNVGMEQINGILYYSLALNPEIRMGKLGMGLDLYFRWNDEGIYPYSTEDILSMVKYVTWGDKFVKPIYARFGILEDSMLGHGFILSHYQNATAYSIQKGFKKLGAQLDIDFKYFGFETITNDISDFKVRGGRFFIRPLALFVKKGILSGFAVGASYIEDTDPYQVQREIITDRKTEEDQLRRYEQYIDIYSQNGIEITDEIKLALFNISLMTDEEARWDAFRNYSLVGNTAGDTSTDIQYLDAGLFDELDDPEKKLSAFAVDFELPIIGNFLVLISDFARIQAYDYTLGERFDTEMGNLYGVKGQLLFGNAMRLMYQVDYRNVPEDFVPAVFNGQYEFLKPLRLCKIEDPKRISGYFGDLNIYIMQNAVRLNVSYEDYVDTPYEEIYPLLKAEFELNPNLIRNLIGYGIGAKFTLQKVDAETIDFDNIINTIIKGMVMIDISKNTQIVYEYFRSWDSFGGEVKQIKLYSQLKF